MALEGMFTDGFCHYEAQSCFRFITICQVLIFSTTCVARALKRPTITTLELTTLAFVFAMVGTSIFWRHKPQDVISPIILKTDTTIAEILKKVSKHIDKNENSGTNISRGG